MIRVLATVVLCTCSAVNAFGAGDVEERFKREAVSNWREYQEKTSVGTIINSVTGRAEDKEVKHEYKYYGNKNSRLYFLRDLLAGDETVYCRNPAYAFEISRRIGNSVWVLKTLDTEGNETLSRAIDMRLGDNLVPFSRMTHLKMKSLEELISQPNFHIESIQYDMKRFAGQRLVRLEFSVPSTPGDDDFFVVQKGTIWMDPENYWCMMAAEATLAGGGGITGRLTIDTEIDEMDGILIPARSESVETWAVEGGSVDYRYSAFGFGFDTATPESREFRLSAFGIPEPHIKDSRAWLWLILTGVVLVGVAVLFYRIQKR